MADINLSPISVLPVLVLLIGIGVVAFIVLMWYLSRTKGATSEARIGQFEIVVLPSGDRITGLTSLARGLVKQEYLQTLAQTERITNEQASGLNSEFEELFFYAIRGKGRGKYLIVSSQNIEDPKFSVPLEQVFELPFGYVTRRLVVADGVSTRRAGWDVYTINPHGVDTEILGDRYTTMVNIGEAAACVKEAAIRLEKEMPWKEVAVAREAQLHEAHIEIAKISHECSELKLALANKPLLEAERPPEGKPAAKGFPWGRFIVPGIAGGICYFVVLPQVRPDLDPVPYSIAFGIFVFFVWPWIRGKLSRWV